MQHFTALKDVNDPTSLLNSAQLFAESPHAQPELGKGKVLGMIFFNSSLRTRMSTQRAAQLLGMDYIVLNIVNDGWQLEFADGVVMDEGKAEHIKEAAAVMGQYCDVLAIRTFASLVDRKADYEEKLLSAFMKYSGIPVISMESATRHPLQSLADWLTISKHIHKPKPRVVLTWAPHPRAHPQAVANSFAEWMQVADVELTIAHPYGMDLSPDFVQRTPVIHNQKVAFQDADVIYAKNWSSYQDYGRANFHEEDWLITAEKMALTNEAKFMHCLPVRRNVVVSDEVIESPNSIVIQQAANRIPAAQAVMVEILKTL